MDELAGAKLDLILGLKDGAGPGQAPHILIVASGRGTINLLFQLCCEL